MNLNPSPYSGDFATPTATFTPTITPTPTTMTRRHGWQGAQYSYESAQPHAVTSVQRGAGSDEFEYDAGGRADRVTAGAAHRSPFTDDSAPAGRERNTAMKAPKRPR